MKDSQETYQTTTKVTNAEKPRKDATQIDKHEEKLDNTIEKLALDIGAHHVLNIFAIGSTYLGNKREFLSAATSISLNKVSH